MNKLVFDVGGTAIKYAIMNEKAEIVEKGNFPTPMIDQPTFIDSLVDIYEKYIDQVDGIAMSLPGRINSDNGYVHTPGALTYNTETHLSRRIAEQIKNRTGREIRISIENDGKAAALAEAWKGNLADVDDGVVIVLGTGIGGGIIHDKKILKGKDFFAGEFSFIMTDLRLKGMGNAFANVSSAHALTSGVARKKGLDPESVDGFQTFEWIQNGDEEAVEVFEEVCNAIGGLIYNLTATLNPEKILIGGGISKQPIVVERIREKADEYFDEIKKIGMEMPRPKIDVCRFNNDSNLIGALYNYNLVYGE